MEPETLKRVRLAGGRYEGLLTSADGAAGVEAVFEGRVIAAASVNADPGRKSGWRVAIDLPPEVIGDGVRVIALRSVATGEVLDRITLMSGAPLDEDIRAELTLMRAELEMLKRAFRRHCAETEAR